MARPRASLTDGLKLAVAVILLYAAITDLTARFYADEGLDFYHFWGIAAARTLDPAGSATGGPYARPDAYTFVLNRAADASTDPRFKQANQRRRIASPKLKTLFDPTATPLCYMTFAFLPLQYSTAHALFRGLQLGSFVAAIVLLFALLRRRSLDGFSWPHSSPQRSFRSRAIWRSATRTAFNCWASSRSWRATFESNENRLDSRGFTLSSPAD